MAQSGDKLLQRPLYIFDLPEELLYTLHLKLQSTAPETSIDPPSSPTTGSPALNGADGQDANITSATSCALCGLSFTNVQEQRSHVRSDLHGYNLKQKLRGRKPVTEAEFEKLVVDLDESISGSDSSDSEDSEADDVAGNKNSTLTALLKRQAKIHDADAEDAPKPQKPRGTGRPPLVWFTSPKMPPNTSLGVFRAIFSPDEQGKPESLAEVIQRKQLSPKPPPKPLKSQFPDDDGGVKLPPSMIQPGSSASGPHYFLCMIGGGHFAAMLVSLTPKMTKKSGVEDRSATVIAHKTFHRYTTRRKQGGSQSANDNAKGNAHSAGSSIRRHNEAALTQEVRVLLADWKHLIDSAELLFIRATGTTNRRTLFGPYEDQVLNSRDSRIRGFPFSTRRATQAELMRAFVELTRFKVSVVDEAALAKQAEEEAKATAAAVAKVETVPQTRPRSPKSKLSKEDEESTVHTTQLQALIRRSKAPAMLSYLTTNKVAPDFSFFPPDQNYHAPTLLHFAASTNSPACVTALLSKASADPTVRSAEGKTAFDLAGDRPTRDAFRLARSQLGEARWPWDTAGIPTALSETEVQARTAREAEEKASEAEREKHRREAEVQKLRKNDVTKVETKLGKGHVMEKPALTAEERRAEQARGMTDEMRLRLEREKRARAAEERMRRLQGGTT